MYMSARYFFCVKVVVEKEGLFFAAAKVIFGQAKNAADVFSHSEKEGRAAKEKEEEELFFFFFGLFFAFAFAALNDLSPYVSLSLSLLYFLGQGLTARYPKPCFPWDLF
jgi:hypothetical protein